MIRLYTMLTSSHFYAFLAGAFAMMCLHAAARRWWWDVAFCAAWCTVSLLGARRVRRDEIEAARG